MNTEKQYAEELGFKIIDLTHSSFLDGNDLEIKNNYIPDGIHPNDKGNELLANKLITEIILKSENLK